MGLAPHLGLDVTANVVIVTYVAENAGDVPRAVRSFSNHAQCASMCIAIEQKALNICWSCLVSAFHCQGAIAVPRALAARGRAELLRGEDAETWMHS